MRVNNWLSQLTIKDGDRELLKLYLPEHKAQDFLRAAIDDPNAERNPTLQIKVVSHWQRIEK